MSADETTRIALSNHKGGVGKTTITAHLAASLANSGDDVLVVDADPQGTLSSHFTLTIEEIKRFMEREVFKVKDRTFLVDGDGRSYGINLNKRLPSIYEAFYHRKFADNFAYHLISVDEAEYEEYAEIRGFEPGTLKENVIVETTDGVDIIPANTMMTGIEKALTSETDGDYRLRNAIHDIDGYDYILIDTPASIGLLKDGSLIACDNVIIPMQAEGTSVTATQQHLEDLENIRDSFDTTLNVLGIVPNEVRQDGEADKITSVIRKTIPNTYWTHREKPTEFSEESLPDEFWTGDVISDDGTLQEGIPEILQDFWDEIGVRPYITENNDYTDCVVPFNLRTRVAIRRAYSNNRTLYTHPEDCDQRENFDKLAEIVRTRTGDNQ